MLITLPSVLTKEAVIEARGVLESAEWVDGNATAGYQSSLTKHNIQLPETSPAARQIGDMILEALGKQPTFMSAALPNKIFPPLFNCYQVGHKFDDHIDNAVRYVKGTPVKIRTDLSMTLFFSEPDEYEGGELIINDTFGEHSIKLAAGDMVLYPASSVHRVLPITKGRRMAAFFWLQSMVASHERRRILFDMDSAIQAMRDSYEDTHPTMIKLTGVYHNVLRQWVET